ncbi:ATP-dependent DNA helicase [Candidatus Sordicultor fermentans]|uniref:ATP-dependent DNA helicase n=1 Tax=Candidatus Sordicultor fermentans TaxID=1953203 RepID=UPI0016963319|nr:ATP-dependent helicase [Candidatus Atribacteria bacterium]
MRTSDFQGKVFPVTGGVKIVKKMELTREEILTEIINKPLPLAEEQAKVVTSEAKHIRVIAGAGTGKTETLTRRLLYLLLYEGVSPESIVAFTFTEKAAASMKTRIYSRIRELTGENFPELSGMYIGTIHAYCLHLLHNYFGYSEFNVLDENQEVALLFRVGHELGIRENVQGRNYLQKCLNFTQAVNIVYNELIDRKRLSEKCDIFHSLLCDYEELLDRYRLLTFGRMIDLAIQNLKKESNRVSYIQYLMVDEYQDINRAQEELIRLLGREASVFVVGDPRQSIYQWRGSDERFFEEFEKCFPGVQTFYLMENRRSVPPIVRAANYFENTFKKGYGPISAKRKDQGFVGLVSLPDPEEEARWVVKEIASAVRSGKCRFKDCAILLRSVANYSVPFINELRRRDIPYLVGGNVGLFFREEAQAMGCLFAWLGKDGFWQAGGSEIRGDLLVQKGVALWSKATGIALDREKIYSELREWREEVLQGKYQNLIQVFHRLLVILGYLKLDPSHSLHAVLMANLGRFSSILFDYESSYRLGGAGVEWNEVVRGLCWYMNAYARGAYEEHSIEDYLTTDAVFISTVHQAKGLEWPVVFVSSVVNARFPSMRAGKEKDWLLPRNLFDAKRYEGSIEEERKLFYVALTRAKNVLCVTYFRTNRSKKGNIVSRRPSVFVEELSEVLPVHTDDAYITFGEIDKSEGEVFQALSLPQVVAYFRCPHFYRLRELWQYRPGLAEELDYGRSLYNCLRMSVELIKAGEKPHRAVERAMTEKFFLPFAGEKKSSAMKQKASATLLEFVENNLDELMKIDKMKAQIELPTDNAVLAGSIDAILEDSEDSAVWMCRTSQEVVTPEEIEFQLGLYALFIKLAQGYIPRTFFVDLGNATVEEFPADEEKVEVVAEKLKDILTGIRSGDFEVSQKKEHCAKCDYSGICRFCDGGSSPPSPKKRVRR